MISYLDHQGPTNDYQIPHSLPLNRQMSHSLKRGSLYLNKQQMRVNKLYLLPMSDLNPSFFEDYGS